MKLLILTTLALIAIAYAGPSISDNFVTWTVVTVKSQDEFIQLTEHIYEDSDDKKQRIDTWIEGTQMTFLTTDGNRYNIRNNGQNCTVQKGYPVLPWFDWLSDATEGDACRVNGVDGTSWHFEVRDVRLQLCFSDDLSVPLDMYIDQHKEQRLTHVTFEFFNGVKPDPKAFDVPKICTSQ